MQSIRHGRTGKSGLLTHPSIYIGCSAYPNNSRAAMDYKLTIALEPLAVEQGNCVDACCGSVEEHQTLLLLILLTTSVEYDPCIAASMPGSIPSAFFFQVQVLFLQSNIYEQHLDTAPFLHLRCFLISGVQVTCPLALFPIALAALLSLGRPSSSSMLRQ